MITKFLHKNSVLTKIRLKKAPTPRTYMTKEQFALLPKRVQQTAQTIPFMVQRPLYCHLTTHKNLMAFRKDPYLPAMAGDFAINEPTILEALKEGNLVHLRGVGGLASFYSRYDYFCSHSVLILGHTKEDGYIVHDPDHTQHPFTKRKVTKMAEKEGLAIEDVRPPCRYMLRALPPKTLHSLFCEDWDIPIVRGDFNSSFKKSQF